MRTAAAFTALTPVLATLGGGLLLGETIGLAEISAAVVTGILWMSGRNATGAFRNRYRYTDTFVRINGKWRCIASQDYLIPAGS